MHPRRRGLVATPPTFEEPQRLRSAASQSSSSWFGANARCSAKKYAASAMRSVRSWALSSLVFAALGFAALFVRFSFLAADVAARLLGRAVAVLFAGLRFFDLLDSEPVAVLVSLVSMKRATRNAIVGATFWRAHSPASGDAIGSSFRDRRQNHMMSNDSPGLQPWPRTTHNGYLALHATSETSERRRDRTEVASFAQSGAGYSCDSASWRPPAAALIPPRHGLPDR